MKQIYLVRHAQSRYDSAVADEHRELTPFGHRQATELGGVLLGLDIEEVHSSPYRRCIDTITPFVQRAALQLNHVDSLRERTFTRDRIDDWDGVWRRVWTDFDFAFPDGESSRQAQARMHAATLHLATTSQATTLAISSHGNAIGLLLQHIDARFTFERACAIRNPDVFRITFDGATLRWDAQFVLEELGTFATCVETKPPAVLLAGE